MTCNLSFIVTIILVHIIIAVFMATGSFRLDMCMVDIPTIDTTTESFNQSGESNGSKRSSWKYNPLKLVLNVVLLKSRENFTLIMMFPFKNETNV